MISIYWLLWPKAKVKATAVGYANMLAAVKNYVGAYCNYFVLNNKFMDKS